MIEINLLPGAAKKAKNRGPGLDAAQFFRTIVARVTDPYLLTATASLVIALGGVGVLYGRQAAKERVLVDHEQRAAQDSTRYAAVLREKHKAESQRDSVLMQLNVIRRIDNDRFVWAHVMEEVSRALPPYTWVTKIEYTVAAAQAATPTAPAPKTDDKKGDAQKSTAAAPPPDATLKFRVQGKTVDIQALTRFIRLLEQSPFIENVQLVKSALTTEGTKEVTAFDLEAQYQKPDSSAIRTVPVTLSVR
ncbi:MAG: hypothetical protein NVS4B6_11150 [Mycobacterium sp.]